MNGIQELWCALNNLERYLRDTPHHNAVEAAAARAALRKWAAQGIEAGTAETEGPGPKDESPVGEADAPSN